MSYDDDYDYWGFPDCEVYEIGYDGDLHAFNVHTVDENGIKYIHTVYPSDIEDMEKCIEALDEGFSPTTGWEDGLGNTVCIGSGEMQTFWIVVEVKEKDYKKDYKVELPDIKDEGVWESIALYDELNKTNVYDLAEDYSSISFYESEPYWCDDISCCPKFKQKKPKKSRRKI